MRRLPKKIELQFSDALFHASSRGPQSPSRSQWIYLLTVIRNSLAEAGSPAMTNNRTRIGRDVAESSDPGCPNAGLAWSACLALRLLSCV